MKCDCFIIIFYGEKTMDLFEYAKSKTLDQESPLASRLRPTTLDEVVGQQHIIGKNTLLYRAIKADKLTSVIFYGPPGTGKTTLAKVIANTTSAEFTQINATVAGKKDMEAVVKEAQQNLGMYGKKTILFIDEIHRFNKGQQDYLLPFVEDGTIILIGATTENPYFEVNAALISRSIIFELKSLEISEVKELILRAVNDKTKGMGNYKARIDEDALDFLADMAGGDARNALNAIELGILTTPVAKTVSSTSPWMWHLSASRNASSATTKTETTTTTSSPPLSKACVAQTLTQQSTILQKCSTPEKTSNS